MNSNDGQGFTLLEVLVALVIFILGVAAFYQAFGAGLQAGTAAEREQLLAEDADRLFSELGRSNTLQDGLINGEFPDGHQWTLRVEPFSPPDANQPAPVIEGHLATLEVYEADHAGAVLRAKTLLLGVHPRE
jgi:prepilin-type N-terminal cleavage/methylation domain-containing protein